MKHTPISRWLAAAVVASTVAAGCSSSTDSSEGADTTSASATAVADTEATQSLDTTAPETTPDTTVAATTPPPDTAAPPDTALAEPDDATAAALEETLAKNGDGCDALDTRSCLLPFPSNHYAALDAATDTGWRVRMPEGAAGANNLGVVIDLAEWNRNDGFSPNSTLLTYVPGLDAEASLLPSWTDFDSALADDASVVLIDSETGERVPLWAELDVRAADDADRALVIHPAIALPEGHHFVVGLRNMNDSSGDPIAPGVVFRAFRDRIASDELEDRRATMEETFATLATAGIAREDLFLAWDFTVASERGLSERMLSIRDQALAQLGDVAPPFIITSSGPTDDADLAFQIGGTYSVPNFLTGDGLAGNGFNYADPSDPDALPVQNGRVEVGFLCNVSVATVAATEPAHLVMYGHGLLGSNDEISAGNVRAFANEHNIVFCATKWAGMSEDDIGNAALTLGEIGNFRTVADRLQQGLLNQIFLGRLMIGTNGLSTLPEFFRADGSSMIDTEHLDFDGNSQGGIMGPALAAVSPDIERAVFGVPAINYSLLLPRSVDFTEYEAIFKPAYPNDLDRMILINMLQMLWDRGEGGGYAQHVTADPYPGTEAKVVLLDIAFGDWQVSHLAAMVMARTMGVTIHRPELADGRSASADLGWGLESTEYPSSGSAAIIWDSGSDDIPLGGEPPFASRDPHADPRSDADVRTQKATFLFEDSLVDACNAAPCEADARD